MRARPRACYVQPVSELSQRRRLQSSPPPPRVSLWLQGRWLLTGACLRDFLLQPHPSPTTAFSPQRRALLAIFASTFLFSLTWQFNQFMMLVQALALFSLDSLDLLPAVKVSLRALGTWPPHALCIPERARDTRLAAESELQTGGTVRGHLARSCVGDT